MVPWEQGESGEGVRREEWKAVPDAWHRVHLYLQRERGGSVSRLGKD